MGTFVCNAYFCLQNGYIATTDGENANDPDAETYPALRSSKRVARMCADRPVLSPLMAAPSAEARPAKAYISLQRSFIQGYHLFRKIICSGRFYVQGDHLFRMARPPVKAIILTASAENESALIMSGRFKRPCALIHRASKDSGTIPHRCRTSRSI